MGMLAQSYDSTYCLSIGDLVELCVWEGCTWEECGLDSYWYSAGNNKVILLQCGTDVAETVNSHTFQVVLMGC